MQPLLTALMTSLPLLEALYGRVGSVRVALRPPATSSFIDPRLIRTPAGGRLDARGVFCAFPPRYASRSAYRVVQCG